MKDCIIVDMDSTLADLNGRGPYDYKACFMDKLNTSIKKHIVNAYNKGITIFIMTGRPKTVESMTKDWLFKYKIPYHKLICKPTELQFQKGVIYKENELNKILKEYNVLYAIDDQDDIIQMFKSRHIKTKKVVNGQICENILIKKYSNIIKNLWKRQ